MKSILQEIKQIRNNKPLIIDYKNNNRYCVVLQETDGTKTAYYFSSPIYNLHTNKGVDMQFYKTENGFSANGSNLDLNIIKNEVYMKNDVGTCRMKLKQEASSSTEYELQCNRDVLLLTTNGLAYKAYIKDSKNVSFEFEVDNHFLNMYVNEKCFSLMSGKFQPYLTISCIGTLSAKNEVISPAKITGQQLDAGKYSFAITPCSPLGEYVMFEFNLYEQKLFQDTTVESRNPKLNNAFGSTAFIGHTEEYGEQWLYSRPDFMKMQELMDKQIYHVILYLPQYNQTRVGISAYNIESRFCSFGSNWENKTAISSIINDSNKTFNYHALDITNLFSESRTKFFHPSEGLILKSKEKGAGFAVIPTGDSCYAPQILEINYK